MSDADFLQNRWPHLKREEKRKSIENIVISKEGVSIELSYFPPRKDITKRIWSLGDSNP
jgi:hypothetical protein